MIANTGDPIVDSIANHLQDEEVGTVGTNLFVHNMPAQVTSGILLLNNATGAQVDPYLPGMRRIVFRIVARGVDRPSAISGLNTVLPFLTLDEVQLDYIYIKHLRYENDPIIFPQSYNSGFIEASVNLTAIYYLKSK